MTEQSRALPFAIRLAAICWIVLLTAVSARVLIAPQASGSVVPIYQDAAQRWQAGEDLYAPFEHHDLYRNPPGFAEAFAILSPLPRKIAGVLWRLLSAAVLLFGLGRFAQATSLSRIQTGWFLAVTAILSIPSMNNGQVNVLLAGSLTLGFALAMEGRFPRAALWFGVAVGLKIYPLAAVLLAAAARPRLALPTACAIAAILALPFATHSSHDALESYRSFAAAVGQDDRSAAALFRAPQNWTILPRLWLDVIVDPRFSLAVNAGMGIVMALIVLRARIGIKMQMAFLLSSIWMTLFGPATEIPTYTLLAPAAAWLAVRHSAGRIAAALLLLPILRGLFPTSDVLAMRSAAPLAAMLLLLVAQFRPMAAAR